MCDKMKGKIQSKINETLKQEFYEHIVDKFGYKRNKSGYELEKAIKLYLTLEGNGSYCNDPDVRELLDALQRSTVTRTQKLSSGHGGDMDLFARAFVKEYEDRKEVTRTELSYFASFTQGVTDHRAVQSRINYLIGSGVLSPSAPNIFNIKKGENMGFR